MGGGDLGVETRGRVREYLYAIGGGRRGMHGKVDCNPSWTRDAAAATSEAAALARPTRSWARPRWSGCRGDSGLTPGSGSAQDKGNRSPGLC